MENKDVLDRILNRPDDKTERIRPRLIRPLDRDHLNTRALDGTEKKYRVCISGRGAGKTTIWVRLYRHNYLKDFTAVNLKRKIKKITSSYIKDIERQINNFLLVKIRLSFNKGELKNGVVDVYVEELDEKENGYNKRPFFRIVALSIDSDELKGQVIPNIKYILFDEFICRLNIGEKYLNDEVNRFKEFYKTIVRWKPEGESLICYFFGNPYSLYNPYFEKWGVDTRRLKPGTLTVGDYYAIDYFEIPPELLEQIKAMDDLDDDEDYDKFAYGGFAVNDSNIPLGDKPEGARLRFVFKVGSEYLGFYYLPERIATSFVKYYCEKLGEWKAEYAKASYCFEFNESEKNTNLFRGENKALTIHLKRNIAENRIVYKDIGANYLTEYIYPKL